MEYDVPVSKETIEDFAVYETVMEDIKCLFFLYMVCYQRSLESGIQGNQLQIAMVLSLFPRLAHRQRALMIAMKTIAKYGATVANRALAQ